MLRQSVYMKPLISVLVMSLMTGDASAECLDLPVTAYVKDAEIVLLGRVDAVRWNFVDANNIDGSIVDITVKALWKGTTPRVIELRQTLDAEGPSFGSNVGQDFVLFVRRLTPERPLNMHPIKQVVTSGFTAQACTWRLAAKIDLTPLGPSRAPVE